MSVKHSTAEKLCLTCGLCCNGVVFANVQLQAGDDFVKLEMLGLPLRKLSPSRAHKIPVASGLVSPDFKFSQPCVAFDGCRCRIYNDRPEYCRAFECALLKKVNENEVKTADALRTIEKARRRAEKVRQLLRKVGDRDENTALSLRFRRTLKRLQQREIDAQTGAILSELTLAVQDLNFLLSEKFYPGSSH